MPIATIRSPMATGICRSETRGTVNTVSVNGMFRRKATMLKNANGMIRYMTLGFLRASVPYLGERHVQEKGDHVEERKRDDQVHDTCNSRCLAENEANGRHSRISSMPSSAWARR